MSEQAPCSKPVLSLPFDYVPKGRRTIIQMEMRREALPRAQEEYLEAIWNMLIACEPDQEGGYTINWRAASSPEIQSDPTKTEGPPKWVAAVRDKEAPRDQPPMAILAAQSAQPPKLFGAIKDELPWILVYTWGEWKAFTEGVIDGGFDFFLTDDTENH